MHLKLSLFILIRANTTKIVECNLKKVIEYVQLYDDVYTIIVMNI